MCISSVWFPRPPEKIKSIKISTVKLPLFSSVPKWGYVLFAFFSVISFIFLCFLANQIRLKFDLNFRKKYGRCAGAFERRRYMNVVVQGARHPQLRNYIHSAVSGLLPFIQKVITFFLLFIKPIFFPFVICWVQKFFFSFFFFWIARKKYVRLFTLKFYFFCYF